MEDEILINQIIKKIEPYLIKEQQNTNFNCITTTNFLVCLMDDFHNSRVNYNESKGINNIPFVFNKKNEFLIYRIILMKILMKDILVCLNISIIKKGNLLKI